MSPKIGVTWDVKPFAPRSARHIDRLRAAVEVVESQGIRVHVRRVGDEHGVNRHSVTGGWAADSTVRPRTVSLVGAVCLALQPIEVGDHPEEGAAHALDVSWDWLLGVLDGYACDPQTVLLRASSGELYRDGFRTGTVLWVEMTLECPSCGERRYRKERQCPGCGR